MKASRQKTIGGFSGIVFSVIWLCCTTGYLIQAGIPSSPPGISETVDLMRQPAYRLLFWLWPVAYLFAIPFAIAAREHLQSTAPASARIGSAFVLIYTGLWFVYHAVIMATISLAQSDPVNESQVGLLFTVVGALSSPLFWAIAIFEGTWAIASLKRDGIERFAGWSFALGSVTTIVYFIMRYTGPYRPAELVHELLILFMIVGIGSLGLSMFRQAENPTS